ncbi:MAG TPA: helix-turn-helix transcriptional regulator [Polyangiaceae bacterium]|nr:helix-turn-helix transcriptional regulator [Polyangiaceae bacterium]
MKIAKRLKTLREHFGWSQADLVAASGLTRPDVSKLESGINRAGSLRVRDALARAYQLNSSEVGEYIDGRRPLESLLPGKKSPIETAIAEHPGRWSTPTIAAARALPFDDRVHSSEWVEHLDEMEQALADAAPRRLWSRTRSSAPPPRSSSRIVAARVARSNGKHTNGERSNGLKLINGESGISRRRRARALAHRR